MTNIFNEYSAKHKKRNTSSSKSISRTRTKGIPIPSTRNIVPSQHRPTRGNNVIPTPVSAVNCSSHGEVEQILLRLFSLDFTKLDESKNKGLFTLRNGLLELRTNYNRYDKQPCVVCGNEHKFEDCEVLNSSGMTAEIAKKVFFIF